jgi:alpha-L-fucosidase 2
MTNKEFDPIERAAAHPIALDRPATRFFEGALLGNGGLGVVVTTRPDAIVLHFGHNDVWDIRVAEKHREEIGTFQEIFERVKAIPRELDRAEDAPWFAAYCEMAQENYRQPYPRPFPCGSLILGFDRRQARLLGHRLDISTGTCTVDLLVDGAPQQVQVFAEQSGDRVWVRTLDASGGTVSSPFNRVRVLPDPDAGKDMPSYTVLEDAPANGMGYRQVLPYQEPDVYDAESGHLKDRAFRLAVTVKADLGNRPHTDWYGRQRDMGPLERAVTSTGSFIACAQLDRGLATQVAVTFPNLPSPTEDNVADAGRTACTAWENYWRRSGVRLQDDFLERIWYWNLYFINCSVGEGVTCPGLFANWSYRQIGTAWHGDYHLNYNIQQPFWMTFSSNHVEKHLPYVDMVDHLMPVSRIWAQEYYGLPGAYFPHSAYPVDMTMNPYPVPTWGWEICETPWAVQSLWWHYLYTLDREFLRSRAFGPIQEAVQFVVAYMTRPDAHGEAWGDDRYHIFPTVVPEIYGIMPGLDKNYDCLVDLTLVKFVFKAYLEACEILGESDAEADLMAAVREILDHFPDYPTAESKRGTVFVSVPGEDPEIIYNVPNAGMTVFPGEEHGLHSSPEEYAIAVNSVRNQQVEGGNDLVFCALQSARLGILDLEAFKHQIEYCLLPNGTCADMVLQVGGRYRDDRPTYDFMAPMGVWFENFALPAVVNECLLQSYNGSLRLFPNWPADQNAEFQTLRAAGAFLVSASFAGGKPQWVEVQSEAGAPLRIELPETWTGGARVIRSSGEERVQSPTLEIATQAGEVVRLYPLED